MSGLEFKVTDEVVEVKAMLVTPTVVRCKLPSMHSYKFSVTVDGKVYAEQEFSIMVFNGFCYDCDPADMTCTEKVRMVP